MSEPYRTMQGEDLVAERPGVGFCVARSTTMGNARASMCGTRDRKTPTLFLVYSSFRSETTLE